MVKLIRIFFLTTCLIMEASCQSVLQYSHSNEIKVQSIARNYFFVHGMCLGYLENTTISLDNFKKLVQLDMLTKYYIVMAITNPNQQNIFNAKQSVIRLIDIISQNKISSKPV